MKSFKIYRINETNLYHVFNTIDGKDFDSCYHVYFRGMINQKKEIIQGYLWKHLAPKTSLCNIHADFKN